MAFLKVLLWIMNIVWVLVILAVLLVLFLLWVKIGVRVDYDEDDGLGMKLKYGFLGLTVWPFTEKRKYRLKKMWNFVRHHFGSAGPRVVGKVQEKSIGVRDKMAVTNEIKTAEKLAGEASRLQEEEARLNAEMRKAEEQLQAAEAAEAAGNPLPDVVDESQVSKLATIKEKVDTFDLEGAYINGKSFIDGFDANSVLALLAFIGSQTKGTLSKVIQKRFTIKEISIGFTVTGEDAADTAIKYGQVASVIFPAMSFLTRNMKVRKYDIELTPDFLATKQKASLHNQIAFRPIRVLGPFLPYLRKVGKETMGVVQDNSSRISANKKAMIAERDAKYLRQTAESALKEIN